MSSGSEYSSVEGKKQVRDNKKVLILVAIGIIAVGLVIIQALLYPKTENDGSLASDFSSVDVDGNNFTLSNHQGSVVVLNFMATWCGYCRSEISELEAVWTLYGETIVIASINVDPSETDEQIRAFRTSYQNATWIWIKDTANVAKAYDVSSIPKTIIVDKNGKIAFTHVGWVSSSTLINEIDRLLG